MQLVGTIVLLLLACALVHCAGSQHGKHHHHKHHHHNKTHTKAVANVAPNKTSASVSAAAAPASSLVKESPEAPKEEAQIMKKMRSLEKELATKEHQSEGLAQKGKIEVNAPLPADFSERFAKAVAAATGSNLAEVQVVSSQPLEAGFAEIEFQAPQDVVRAVQSQAADPASSLATGQLHSFLVARSDAGAGAEGVAAQGGEAAQAVSSEAEEAAPAAEDAETEPTPKQDKGIDIDTAMPYGELEPFGREDTAQELTESSVTESNEMVDQVERAEVAEEKRSVFRALTRLRGAAITSFDGVARSQTGNIDEYNKVHKWRSTHPLHHLADEESDISKWAFPDNADF